MIKHYLILLTILLSATLSFGQGTETFTNIPTATPASYLTRTWTGDGSISWTSTDSRTDQTLNGKAIGIRNGTLTSGTIPNGVASLSFSYKYIFTGSAASLTVRVNGVVAGTIAVPSTATAPLTASFPSVNAAGNSIIEIQQTVSGGPRVAIDDVSWTPLSASPCTEPVAQPTALTFPTVVSNSISGSFTATTADKYLVVRSLSNTLSATPTDGTTYAAGTALGGGTVVSNSSATTFTDNGLTATTQYFYFIFAYNDQSCTGGANYNVTTPLQNDATTPAVPACATPAAPTALALTPANTSIAGSFTGSGASKYLAIISTSTPLSAAPANGTAYTAGQAIGNGTVVKYGTGTTFSATGLTPATQYYLYIFAVNDACTGEPFYSTTSLNGTSTTTNNTNGIPAGYYDAAAGLTCGPLKNALSSIITTGQTALTYTTIDDVQMPVVDTIRSDDGASSIIWDIYSNNNNGAEPFVFSSAQIIPGGFCVGGGSSISTEGGCWNKEHTFPRSFFKLTSSAYQQPTEADLFIVRATDKVINGNRSNYPYSIVGGTPSYQFPATTSTYPGVPVILDKLGASTATGITGTAFEPNAAVKGDIARGYFYIMTRYQSNLSTWVSLNGSSGTLSSTAIETIVDGTTGGGTYPSFKLPYLTMLYNWHVSDPVDAKEINRNNLVYSQQNNRNPYVDHPEYVALVFQCTGAVPVTIVDFTAQKVNEAVLLKWYATYETSFRRYDVERSTDGITFNKIGEVAGTNLSNYNFTDNNLPKASVLYYRLKMIDIDGGSKYSKVAPIRLNNNLSNAIVYPNPTRDNLHIKLYEALQGNSTLQVLDITGRLVRTQSVSAAQLNISLDVRSLPAGRYFIKISNSKQVINESFVVTQ